jgi:serine/threonine-protein kinase
MRISAPACLFFLSAFLAGSLLTGAFADAGAWLTYHNDRFGATADVPKGWTMGPAPENDDGRVFTAPDGAARLIISGSLNIEDNLDDAFKFYETPHAGDTITYKRRIGPAITISGTSGTNILYAKHLLSCHNQIWNSIYLLYPAAQKAAFDAIAIHVAKSLRPGPGYQIENCRP